MKYPVFFIDGIPKGQKLSCNEESVNVSKIDTFIFLKPGILGKNDPRI